MTRLTLTLREAHHRQLVGLTMPDGGHEHVAYVLCGRADVAGEPWDGSPQRRYLSREVVPVAAPDVISASAEHVRTRTGTFAGLLKRARDEDLTIAVVHSHPAGYDRFSEVDDADEPALVQLAQNRNGGAAEVLSVVLGRSGRMFGRVWQAPGRHQPLAAVRVVGDRLRLDFPGRGEGETPEELARQALAFGPALNADLGALSVGVIGCGATGSATGMFLARLGVRRILAVDADVVERTNLNRLHGSTVRDVGKTPKVELLRRVLEDIGVGVRVATHRGWVGDEAVRDALKSCDVIFGCTDDDDGRLLLNRLAYFYLVPVIDMGFQIDVDGSSPPRVLEAAGRVTVLGPERRCLMCRNVIDVQAAHADQLRRLNPDEFHRQEQEQYVRGGGRRDPSVVTFTTDVACMAVDELLHQLTGYRKVGSIAHRVRKYALGEDKRPGTGDGCSICGGQDYWGRGDCQPFLDRTG